MEKKRFRIPNEDINITIDEALITQTRTFQRLFHLKQLGLAYLVYPCATHTRGGHSIQCLNEATKILQSLDPPPCEGSEEFTNVRIAALLHDIGHIPFSHTLEDEHEVLQEKHDKAERLDRVLLFLKKELNKKQASLVDRAKPILLAIAEKDDERSDWQSDLVGNTVCADLLAYITTDAEWTGIEKRPGYYRIYEYFRVKNNHLCIRLTKGGLRTDIVSAILDLLDMRYALTERVVFHHTKCVASAMLARAVRLCKLEINDELLMMGDECFLNYIKSLTKKEGTTDEIKGVGILIDQLSSRRLYKRIFKVGSESRRQWDRRSKENHKFCNKWRNGEHVEGLLRKIEERHKIPCGTLVLWCPKGKAGMKLVEANVIWEHSDGWSEPVKLRSDDVQRQFPGVWDRVNTIENQYKDLWTFWIALHPNYVNKARSIIASLESELGIECDPVFIDSYAKTHLPGFAESSKLFSQVEDRWEGQILPDVTTRLYDYAARTSSDIDDATIADTIKTVAEEKVKVEGEKSRKSKHQAIPLSRKEIENFFKKESKDLKDKRVKVRFTEDLESIIDCIESLSPELRPKIFSDLEERFFNESRSIFNDIKAEQIVNIIKRKYKS